MFLSLVQIYRRPTPLHDPSRDSDDDDYHDKDYDVATLTNNLSQAFGYGFYENADSNEVSNFFIIILLA